MLNRTTIGVINDINISRICYFALEYLDASTLGMEKLNDRSSIFLAVRILCVQPFPNMVGAWQTSTTMTDEANDKRSQTLPLSDNYVLLFHGAIGKLR
jgi:hypothetical protein